MILGISGGHSSSVKKRRRYWAASQSVFHFDTASCLVSLASRSAACIGIVTYSGLAGTSGRITARNMKAADMFISRGYHSGPGHLVVRMEEHLVAVLVAIMRGVDTVIWVRHGGCRRACRGDCHVLVTTILRGFVPCGFAFQGAITVSSQITAPAKAVPAAMIATAMLWPLLR